MGDDAHLQSALVKLFSAQQHLHNHVVATFFSANQARVQRLLGKSVVMPGLLKTSLVLTSMFIGLGLSYQALASEANVEPVSTCLEVQMMCEDVMSYMQYSLPEAPVKAPLSTPSSSELPMSFSR